MRPIPSLRFVTLTAGAAFAVLLVTPALSPVAGDRFMKAVLPTTGDAGETKEQAGDKISLVHGAIAGAIPSSSSAWETLPVGDRWSCTSASDWEFRHLLITLHKGARPAAEQPSLLRMIGDFLTLSGTRSSGLREETVLDPEFGEISMDLDLRLGRPHSVSGSGSGSRGANDSMLRSFEASLLADIEQAAPADTSPMGYDYARAPIGINTPSSEGGTVVISGQSLSNWTSSGTNTVATYLPPAPAWYGLPPSAPLNATYPAGSFSGGPVVLNAPLNAPPVPNWNSFVPPAAAGNGSSGVFHERFFTSSATTSTVLSNAPALVSVTPAIASLTPAVVTPAQTVTVPSSAGLAGATLTINVATSNLATNKFATNDFTTTNVRTSNLVTAPSSPADPGTFQPQTGSTAVIYIANNQIEGSGTVKEYSATAGGPALSSNNGFTFTTISSPDPTAVTAVGTLPTLPGLWVGDSASDTVKAYSAQLGTQINPGLFTTITGVVPNALVVSSNGQNLFVANNAGNVKEYNALTGTVIGSFSVSTPNPISLTLSTNNQDIYIGDGSNGTVLEYAVSNGALVGGFSIINVYPGGLAMSASGQTLFVAEEDSNAVTEYNATTGTSIGFSLSPVPGEPVNLLGVGNDIYLADDGGISGSGSQVEFYSDTGSTGTAVGGFTNINGLDPTAIAYVPEPSTAFLLLGSGAIFLLRRRRASG